MKLTLTTISLWVLSLGAFAQFEVPVPYNPDGNGLISVVDQQGCTDSTACNFDASATIDDGSCVPCSVVSSFCGEGTAWDDSTQTCISIVTPAPSCPGDFTEDGYIGVDDILSMLSLYDTYCTIDFFCDGVVLTAGQCGDPISYQGYDYETVLIGDQCWFAENLRTENYANGDAIAANLSVSEWASTPSGAVAVYGEGNSACSDSIPNVDACDEAWSLNEYGRLYNWYAVEDPRGLCPCGWHVPTDGEWTVMTDFLGGESVAGGQMKTDYGWYNGGNGTNSIGFKGLPGGRRHSVNSDFIDAGFRGGWWTSSPDEYEPNYFSYSRGLRSSYQGVTRGLHSLRNGLSVRCIKDAE